MATPLPLPSAPLAGSRVPPRETLRRRGARPAPAPAPLAPLDMRLLADLPNLELQARYMVDGFLSGMHRSPHKGSSAEFAEYRGYQQGDDLRRIDWRLYARSDRLHVKQYEEETQLRMFLVLDHSASMNFRSPRAGFRKIEYARIVLAALGLLAQRERDAVGFGLAGAELTDFLRAGSSPAHWRSVIARLDAIRPVGEASVAAALEALAELAPPRSLIVVASDFYEELPRVEAALGRLRYDHHDFIGLHVLDPVEIDFDVDDSGTFVDLETDRKMELDAPAVRQGYLERFGRFCNDLDDLFRDAGGDMVRLRTDSPAMDALARYLGQRQQRLK